MRASTSPPGASRQSAVLRESWLGAAALAEAIGPRGDVLLVGRGAIGSKIAERLRKAGATKIDRVEPNLAVPPERPAQLLLWPFFAEAGAPVDMLLPALAETGMAVV